MIPPLSRPSVAHPREQFQQVTAICRRPAEDSEPPARQVIGEPGYQFMIRSAEPIPDRDTTSRPGSPGTASADPRTILKQPCRFPGVPERSNMGGHSLDHHRLGLMPRIGSGDDPGQIRRVRRVARLVVSLEDHDVALHGRSLRRAGLELMAAYGPEASAADSSPGTGKS